MHDKPRMLVRCAATQQRQYSDQPTEASCDLLKLQPTHSLHRHAAAHLMWLRETISPGVTTPSNVLGRVRSCQASSKGSRGGTGGGGGGGGGASSILLCLLRCGVAVLASATAHG